MWGLVLDAVYMTLQGIAVVGLLAGLVWMIWQSVERPARLPPEIVNRPILLPLSGDFGVLAKPRDAAPEIEPVPPHFAASSDRNPAHKQPPA